MINKPDQTQDDSTLKESEYHPAANQAMAWFKMAVHFRMYEYLMIKESLASTALSGNRQAQVCMGTINRL